MPAGIRGPKTVLIVEESRPFREAMRDLLARADLLVLTAQNGVEARQLLEDQAASIDLMVLALDLGEVDGFDFLAWLRAERPRLRVPILALAGSFDMAETVRRLQGLEAVGVHDRRAVWHQLAYRVNGILYPGMADSRAYPRLPAGVPVNCQVGEELLQGTISNISRTGMFIAVELPAPPPAQVLVQFILPGIPHLFEIHGQLVWVGGREGLGKGMGIRFLDLPEADQAQIGAYVRMELERFAPSFPSRAG